MERRTGLSLDPKRVEPLHRQIFDQVVQRIQSGAFPGGHRLPPTRELASEVGAHRNTVVRAYEDLVEAGFVTSTVGRGTFVASAPPAMPLRIVASAADLPFRALLSRVATERAAVASGRREPSPAIAPTAMDAVNLASEDPSADLLPHELYRRCVDYVLRTLGPRALSTLPPEGTHHLRGLIAEELRRQGVPATAETILITGGEARTLDLLARALVDPGDAVLVDALTSRAAAAVLTAAGAHLIPVPDDGEGPSLAFLKRHARASAKGFYLTPSEGRASGVALSLERRAAVVAWSREARVPLVEGETAAELRLDGGALPPPLRALDGDVVHAGGYSRRLSPALEVGYVVCPAALRPALVALQQATGTGASALAQHALAEFLERGYLRAHRARVTPQYRARREALDSALTPNLPRGARLRRPEHGAHLWLSLPPWMSADRVEAEARRRGVLVATSAAAAFPDERPALRLSFAAEPPPRLIEGARRLGKVLASLLGHAGQLRETG
jgi:GntR family transcriptional regulator / MocR family aminotransferase